MRILFFISASVEGKGGHYHSLDMISTEMAKHVEVAIIGLGPGKSVVLQNNPHFRRLIYTDGLPTASVIRNVLQEVKSFRPDIIHCFDDKTYDFISYILALTGNSHYPILINRCGGANSPSYPVVKHMVLFMQENLEFYQKHPRFKDSKLYLIPNRVSPLLEKRESEIFRKKDNEFFLFRIGRIGKTYRKTLMDSIELAKRLKERGISNFTLFLIGTNDDPEIYRQIVELTKDLPVRIVTDDQVTSKASAYLHYADAAICTGRGFMEACSLGIPVLAGSVNHAVPVPVNPKNFHDFFYYNFSERAVLKEPVGGDMLDETIRIMLDPTVKAEYGRYASGFFEEYFDIGHAVEKYFAVYKEIAGRKVPYFIHKNLMNFLRTARFFRASRERVRKLQLHKQQLPAATA